MTKGISLTQGKVAVVDDDMQYELNKYKWCARKDRNVWYALRNDNIEGKRITVRMHRHILGLKYNDGKIADHINRNGLDNRRSNLRIVSVSENNFNHGLRSDNTSGHNGICWDNSRNRWRVGIGTEGKWLTLGRHIDLNDALEARKQGEATYWQT